MHLLRLGVLLAAALPCLCAAGPESRIDASDQGAIPGARLIVAVGDKAEAHAAGRAVEIGISGFSGRRTQTLPPGANPVIWEQVAFQAPAELRNDFDFRYVDVNYRLRAVPHGGNVGFDILVGVGYGDFDLTVTSPSRSASGSLSAGTLSAGIGLVFALRPGTVIEARYSYAEFMSFELGHLERFEVGLAHAFTRNLGLRAGYAHWELDRGTTLGPHVNMRFSGPALGLDLMF